MDERLRFVARLIEGEARPASVDPLISDLRTAVSAIVGKILTQPTWPLCLSQDDRAFVLQCLALVVLMDCKDDVPH